MSPRTKKQFNELREKSKENIIDSAMKLFSKNGFFNTSIRQIAQKASVSNGLLYNYFSSKEDLLVEIINKSFKILDSVVLNSTALTAEQKIESLINNFFNLVENRQKLLRMMMQIGLQTEKFEFVNSMIAKKYKEEVRIISNSFHEIGIVESDTEARILMATLDGILIQSLIIKDTLPLTEMKTFLIAKYKK